MLRSQIKKIIFSTFTFLAFFIYGCDSSSRSQADIVALHEKQAATYLTAQQYRAAHIEARNVIQKSPRSPSGFILLAKISNALGHYKDALEILERVSAADQGSASYLTVKLEALIGRGKYQSAIELLDLTSTSSTLEKVNFALFEGEAALGLLELERAGNAYRRAFELGEQETAAHQKRYITTEALLGLAQIELAKNDYTSTTGYLDQIAELDPDKVHAYILRAQIEIANGDFESAENILTEALLHIRDGDAISPEKAYVLRNLSEVLVKQGRSSEALIYTQVLAEAFPGYEIAATQYDLALEHFEAGKLEESEEILEKLVEEYPRFEQGSVMLAVIRYRNQDYESASSLFNQNLDAELAHPEITALSAIANLKAQRPEKVQELLEQQVNDSRDPVLLALYGSASLAAGDAANGEKFLLKALSLGPDNVGAILSLAKYYSEKTPPALARANNYFEQAYSLEPFNIKVARELVQFYVKINQHDSAKTIVEEQLSRQQNAEATLLAADFYVSEESIEKAANYYQKTLENDPENFKAALMLAELDREQSSNFTAVQNGYLKALEIQPDSIVTYMRLLNFAQEKNSLNSVETVLNSFAKKQNDVHAYGAMALFLSQKGENDSATNYFNKFNREQVDDNLYRNLGQQVHYSNALAVARSGNFSSARQMVFEGLKIAPQSLPLLVLLTDLEIREENYSEALKLAQQIENANPPTGLQLRARIASASGNPDVAYTLFSQLWEQSPSDQTAVELLGLTEQKNPEKVGQLIQQWIDRLPDSINAKLAQSRQLLVAGDFEQAIPVMREIRVELPENALNLNNLAWALNQTGNDEAEAIAAEAVALQSENPSILDTYGWILFQNGKLEFAIEHLAKAASLAPGNEEIASHLQSARTALEKTD